MSNLVKLIIIGILIVAIPVSVKLVQEQQILKSRAAQTNNAPTNNAPGGDSFPNDCVGEGPSPYNNIARGTPCGDGGECDGLGSCVSSGGGGGGNQSGEPPIEGDCSDVRNLCLGDAFHCNGERYVDSCGYGCVGTFEGACDAAQATQVCSGQLYPGTCGRSCVGTKDCSSAGGQQQPPSGAVTTCSNGHAVGDVWPECRECDEGVVTCNGGDDYSFRSERNPSPNCGSSCSNVGVGTPDTGTPSTPSTPSTPTGGTQPNACRIPMSSFTGNSSCTMVPNNSYRWVIIQPGTGGAPAIDAARFGANNACGGANDAAAHAVCPQNTSDSSNVRASTSMWCYEFTEGNRCIQLRHEGTGGGPGTDTGTCNIDDQSPDLGPTCAACLSTKTSPTNVPRVIANIKGMNSASFNGCSDQKILNKWCNGFGADAASQCNELKTGVCATSCGGSLPNPNPPANDPRGYFDSASCEAITGWTCDADSYSTPLRVDFYANGPAGQGVGIGSVTANQQREAGVGGQCGGNNAHGFSFAVPATLRDGQPHSIYAYGINTGAGSNVLLQGSPKSVTCTAAPITAAPACNTPAGGSTVNPQNVSFSWGAVSGATIYDFRLWEYNSGNFERESIAVNRLTGTSYNGSGGTVIDNKTLGSPINLTAGKNYRYRVSARTSATGAPGPWSDCNFTAAASTPRIEFRVAENPTALAGAPWELYTGADMTRNYTFQDQRPGVKTIFVEFRDAEGNQEQHTAQIEILAPAAPSPTPSPTPAPTTTPTPAPVTTTHYRIAETPADLSGALWQPYTVEPVKIDNFEFKDKTPGPKFIWAEFKDSRGRVERRNIGIRLLGDDPAITSCSLGFEGSNTILKIKGRNFGSARGTVRSGGTALQIRGSWSDNSLEATLTTANPGQAIPVSVINADSQSGDGSCGSISTLALGAKLFCQQPASHQTDNVDLTLVEAFAGGGRFNQKVTIDKDGIVSGLTRRLESGKDYVLSIKAPRSIRRNVPFRAGDGITNVPNFVLWVGDIFPADGGDGKINSLDKRELNNQWSVTSDARGRSGDFNQDGRVNSIDWACMRVSMVDSEGRGDEPEPNPGIQPSPIPSSSPAVGPAASASPATSSSPSPSVSPTVSPSPTASPESESPG